MKLIIALFAAGIGSRLVKAQRNYAVYYDPAEAPNRNPRGDGFIPKGPNEWNQVVSEASMKIRFLYQFACVGSFLTQLFSFHINIE
jgi:hypothetical protein